MSFSTYAQLGPISGTMGCCIGSASYLTDVDSSFSGGTWSSSSTAIASVTTTGIGATATVRGISAGVATITYWYGGSYVTTSFTVYAAPTPIAGATPTCIGTTSVLSDATVGGTWSSGNISVATVNATTGVVTGAGGGSTYIYYTVGTGCSVSIAVAISSTTVTDSITGPASVCVGSFITLADATPGGVWTSGSVAIATVSGGGIVGGVSSGATDITYTVTSACSGSASAYKHITVGGGTSAGTISGSSSVMVGSSTTLADGVAGGTWSSGSTTIATVNASSGVVTGVAIGTATITYTVSGCGGTATTTAVVTVTAFDGISGNVNFTSGSYSGAVKVWLITYNPITLILEAVDSTVVSCTGTSVYYQFTGVGTDSFRVKADALDDSGLTTGYVPTYHTTAYYWHDADAFYHVSGTSTTGENINMATGTITSGPGFVGGNVTSGANRGTSTGAPVVGLLIFLQNSSTGAIVQQVYTDASGNYAFSSLPYGTYFVYPELMNYKTTPYTSITISASSASVSNASFIEHTVSKTITPVDEAVNNVKSTVASIVAYPNPTSGKLNILWNTGTNETGNVSITDITGREVYKSTIQMTAGSGISQVDLSGLTNGLYLISVKSASITYNNKIELQH